MNRKLAIIADDFTGSNDTGVQFRKKGLMTGVITQLEGIEEALTNLDVVVVDTESRFDPKEVAYEKVARATEILYRNGVEYIYKKLDSTLRGNIGAEIEAAMDASESKVAIVVPALPQNGRTTVGGTHLIHHVPLEKTEIAKDPITPVNYSYIPHIIALQTNKKISLISIQEVLKGFQYIAQRVRVLSEKGSEVIVVDALEGEDLSNIAKAIPLIDQRVLLVGSAGLAEYLPKALGITGEKVERKKAGSVVVMAGSVSDITRRQVNYAIQSPSIKVIDVDLVKVFTSTDEEKKRIMEITKHYIEENKDVIIRTAKSRENVEEARRVGKENNLDAYQVSEKIAQFLGEITKEICVQLEIKGLLLTGGDIAIKAAKLMGISGTIIEDEILPAIPSGRFISKEFGHIPIATKAGAFGQEDAMVKIIDYFKKG